MTKPVQPTQGAELWMTIDGFKKYEASSYGRIRNISTGHILKPSKNAHGYAVVSLSQNDGQRKSRRIHPIVARIFVQPVEGKTHVNHIDGNKMNNAASNFEWVTPSENNTHAALLFLAAGQKITAEQMLEIRAKRHLKLSNREIGFFYGISHDRVRDIFAGRDIKSALLLESMKGLNK